jgi:predicted enzyme related to lactoylglutathione lyase
LLAELLQQPFLSALRAPAFPRERVNPMQIHSARFFVYATDLARSLSFYTELLQLQVVDRIVGGVILGAGTTQIELLQDRRDTEIDLERRTGFTLLVDDADAVYASLQAQGIPISSELTTTVDGARIFYIVDPDGLPVGIRSQHPQTLAPGDWA